MKTGEARLLGKPSKIGAPFSWLPDGDGLILKRFETQDDPKAVEPRILCRLGLDGELTDLRSGDWPVVLRKTRRILFEENATRLWHTCQLDGSDPKLFADGLKGYSMPAVSPDEKRVVFVRYEHPGLAIGQVAPPCGLLVLESEAFSAAFIRLTQFSSSVEWPRCSWP